ncbi:MAG: ribonuclease Z [Desulfobacterales bacterium]|nr:ribonuclease Z [Desulfobacterales bacterium]MBF0398317.1 ribonuclease Z [Desulfobacterales bacterium]
MKIIFLGTNGWYDTKIGNTLCILIDSKDYYVILDAGNGIHKLNSYFHFDKATFLFLSHFHLDHVVGLHILNKFKFSKGLKIVGPKGTRSIVNILLNKPFSMPMSDLPFPVEVFELPDDREKIPFEVLGLELCHVVLTMGYRIILNGKSIAFCPDTGYCENAVNLAKDADLLIAECAYLPNEEFSHWPHLNPEYAAKIAKEANASQLALVHFDANRYPTIELRLKAESAAKNIFSNSFAAMDDMQIDI